MDTTKLELKNLGAKHRYYNEMVKEAITNNHIKINLETEDVNILAQIDIASHKRNVDFVLDIFKSDDLLYVSRAIKKCTWLITDNSYAHVINPDYLNTHLYPNMTAKAKQKLRKHIKNNIKDELRAEKFYLSEETIDAALKWLPKCSITFIESKVVDHHDKIKKTRLFKKLCERSINILNLIEDNCLSRERMKAAKFIQKKDIALFLKTIDRMPYYEIQNFNRKTTKLLMAYCSNYFIENFHKYCKYLDVSTFIKFLKPENVKDFIYKQASLELEDTFQLRYLFSLERFQHFVQRMPKDEQFDFVNKVFVEKVHKSHVGEILPDSEMSKMKKLFNHFNCPTYVWYNFAPFEVAFNEIRHYSSNERLEFLKFLIKCCRQNQSYIQSVLKYYRDKHLKDSYDSKISFIDELLSNSNFYHYDAITWNILNEIFKSLDIYSESEKESSKYIEIVILYKLIKNEPIQEQLDKKYNFKNTFKKYGNKLKPDEQYRIFNFIFNHVIRKTDSLNKIEREEQLDLMVELLKSVLEIMKDWKKELVDYPFVLQKIKNLVKIKMEKSWKSDLSCLYNVKKSWKQLIFEESLILEPSEKVCINALKHDPGLLVRYKDKVENLVCDRKLYLGKFLRKVRIYNSESLNKELINSNLLRLGQSTDQNIVIRNLCTLMTQEEILKVINKYGPKEAKINWDEEDDLMFSIRCNIAKNMHFTRPHPPPDVILEYAKGDYLQYAVPSVLAVFNNMKSSLFREHVNKLFNSKVCLQKLGIRLAITKLHYDDLVTHFYNLWTNTKNTSIRSVIFQLTFKLLCRQKDVHKIEEMWNLLKIFIDNLTFKEDKAVYSLMYTTEGVSHTIKANYIEINHTFLESYLAQADVNIDELERYYMEERLILNSTDVMENLNDEFIVRVFKKFIDSKFFCKSPHAKQPRHRYLNQCDGIISVLAIYLLCAKDEKKQEIKFKSVLLPILKRALPKLKEEYRWKANIKSLLDYLRINLHKYALKNNMVLPLKMFSDINDELTNSLHIPEFYYLLTQWKLTVEYVKHLILYKSSSDANNKTDKNIINTELFGCKCLEILKDDVEKHFPRIYLIFHKVLYETLKDLCTEEARSQIYKYMLSDKEFIPGYLTIIKIAAIYNEKNGTWDELLHILEDHPSREVQMHYYYYFNENK